MYHAHNVLIFSRYDSDRNIELDNILLVVAQTGVYLYASFNIIGSHFSGDVYQLITGIMSIVQVGREQRVQGSMMRSHLMPME